MLRIRNKGILNNISKLISEGVIWRAIFNTGVGIVYVLCGTLIYNAIKTNDMYVKFYLIWFVLLVMMFIHAISNLNKSN